MTANKNIVSLCDVLSCSISDHHLIYLVLTLKPPRLKPSYITIRSYSNYNAERFREDLAFVPFHMISMFDDLDDHVDTFNDLFADVLNEHASIKRIKIKARPLPLITEEIRQLMSTRDICHRRAIRSNDRLHWDAYRCFRQEVKRELRFAEMTHVRTELLKSKGNTSVIWKIINNCLPRKSRNRPFITENPTALANKFNEYFTSVGSVTAQKARDLAIEHNFDIHPASSAVEPLPDQCSEAFQFHSVLDKDVERVEASLQTKHLATTEYLHVYSRIVYH